MMTELSFLTELSLWLRSAVDRA